MLPSSVYKSVFDAHPVGHYLLSPTPEFVILAVNDAFLQASGRTRDDLLGTGLFAAFPGSPDDTDDSNVVTLRASLHRVLASKKPDTLPAQRYPIPVRLPSGEVRYEERYWDAVSTPVLDAEGRIACISHTTTDVTDRVRADMALNLSETRYRALTRATADVIYRMNPDWTQLHELDGRGVLEDTPQDRDRWLEDYIPPEDQASVQQAIETAIRNKSLFELEHRVRRADGSVGWTLSRAVPMLNAQGEIYEWIGAASDITERRLAEEKLQDAARRKDQFLAMLAHELRNPLAPIGAAAELLTMNKQGDPMVFRTSEIIARQVSHMKGLIDDLLDVSRVSSGLIELEWAPLSLFQILQEAIEQVSPLIEARKHYLESRLPPETLIVMGDRKRLVQIFANILNNAAKYTPEGGRLELHTRVQEHHVQIDISDNGIGMTREMAAHAFELFTQAERTSDRSSGGLGLGLALVKSLVELHSGTVFCQSSGLGHGSRFTVCLPQHELGDSGPAVDDSKAQMPGKSALRIMIVDDNVDASDMLAMLLQTFGHDVKVEHSSHEALAHADGSFDAFLLDIGLPGMDGYDLCRRLREQPATADAALIAITGYGQQSDRQSATAAGFDYHLVKPVNLAILESTLEELSHRVRGRK